MKMNLIRSHKHDIYSETANKIALSADDDNRVIDRDGISTLTYDHHMLEVSFLISKKNLCSLFFFKLSQHHLAASNY